MFRRCIGALAGLAIAAVVAVPVEAAGPLEKRCTYTRAPGFSVSYPNDWYTNEATTISGSEISACSQFAPYEDIDVYLEATHPIFLKFELGDVPVSGTPVIVDGRPGVRTETERPDGQHWYEYWVQIDANTYFRAFAFEDQGAPYEEAKAVLDAMMGTIDFDGGGSAGSGAGTTGTNSATGGAAGGGGAGADTAGGSGLLPNTAMARPSTARGASFAAR